MIDAPKWTFAALAALAASCGGAPTPEPARVDSAPATEAIEPAAAPTATPGGIEADILRRRLTLEDPERPRHFTPLSALRAECPTDVGESDDAILAWYEDCAISGTAAFDPARAAWVVFDVDYSEGGPEHLTLSVVTPDEERALVSGEVTPASVAAAAAAAPTNLPTPTQLVERVAIEDFSLNEYAPLVALGGPLDGALLYIETVHDLDAPAHVLWLAAPDAAPRALARRSAPLGPCDGDGYWCEATDAECDEAGLRAEGRLCVLPLGIHAVALGPDGTLLVQGRVQVAGHGGYPPFHWVARVAPPPDP